MNIRVVDTEGKLLGQSRDMASLVAEFRAGEPAAAAPRADSPEQKMLNAGTLVTCRQFGSRQQRDLK